MGIIDATTEKMKMKIVYLLSAAVIITIAAAEALLAAPKPDPVILKNEVILQKGPGEYMEVRHIVLKGSNEEIGRALADIAQKDYKASLVKYASPIYAKARLEYMKRNYPILLERMKGVARSYGLSLEDTDLDTSSLYYCMPAPKCSAAFFPARISANKHNFYVLNRDYYLASMSEIMDAKRLPGEGDFLSRMFVIEMYPDKGYPSIAIGALDLLNMHVDAVNSKGLSVAMLEDDTYGMERIMKDLSRQSGLNMSQAIRLIVDTCATVEEAKEAILNNKISVTLLPTHFMVMDSSGRSFIYERFSKDFSDRFLDNDGLPQLITNHSVCDYPTVDKFPKAPEDEYDTFNRYRRLDEYVRGHVGKYSIEDGKHAMSLVYGCVNEATEGGYHALPLRTLYTAVVDIDERAISVKFYLRDGKIDSATGVPELVFSKPFEFKLKE